jgi:hypothetical protein
MNRYQHALLGGIFIGVVSVLPVVNFLNCCCLWVIAGGVLSTYLLQQNRPDPVDSGEAAIGGLLAGLIGGAIYVLVHIAIFSAAGGQVDQIRAAMARQPQVTPEMREMLDRVLSPRNLVLMITATTLVAYPLFAMLGALLGTVFFKKKVPPTTPS